MQLFTNNATTTLATGIGAGASSFSVAPGDGSKFPAPTGGDFFAVTLLVPGVPETNVEIVYVSARSGDTFSSVLRGQEGTTAASHALGDAVQLRVTAAFANGVGVALAAKEVAANKNATNGYAGLGASYSLVLKNAAGAVSSALASLATAPRTWSLPDKNGTVAMTSDITGTNSGTNTGDQTIALTGDVTGTGIGTFAATIAANAVTLGKMAQVSSAVLLGRSTAGTGNVESLSAATARGLLSLDNVTNTSDANKPVSTAQQAALDLKQNLVGKDASGGYPGLTGYSINFKNPSGTNASMLSHANTAARTYTFPDKTGTVALIDDVAASTGLTSFIFSRVFQQSGTFTAPVSGYYEILLVGASGTGGAATGANARATGGATGGVCRAIRYLTAGQTCVHTLASGCAPVIAISSQQVVNGNTGGASTVMIPGAATMTANGGSGGSASASAVALAGAIGGTASGGDVNIQGSPSGSISAAANVSATGGGGVPILGTAVPSGSVTAAGSASGGAGMGGPSGAVSGANSASGGGGSGGGSAQVTGPTTFSAGGVNLDGVSTAALSTYSEALFNATAGGTAGVYGGGTGDALAGAGSGGASATSGSFTTGNSGIFGGSGAGVSTSSAVVSVTVKGAGLFGGGSGGAVALNTNSSAQAGGSPAAWVRYAWKP